MWNCTQRMWMAVLLAGLATALVAVGSGESSAQPFFVGIGDLSGGEYDSVANAVSADGSVVVGVSTSANGDEAFRWTPQDGMGDPGLGDLSGGIFLSAANGVSANGSVIAGSSVNGNDESRAFRWTQANGMVGLPAFFCLSCANHAFGHAVSGNASVVVGAGSIDSRVEAARWTGGFFDPGGLGYLSGGGDASTAYDVSYDGSVIVGDSDSSVGNQGFWWSSGSMHALGGVSGALLASTAVAISADASTIVGAANTSATSTNQMEAVRWSGAGYTTLTLLPRLPGVTVPRSRAEAVSGDGAIVVGTSNDENNADVAFIWDAVHGTRKLAEVMVEDYGLDLDGWKLTEARGISDVDANGAFTVVGAGVNPNGDAEGWVAFLSPVECNDGADNDSDGLVDFPEDPECLRKSDRSEVADCADGIDNDGDGNVDWNGGPLSEPADAQCSAADDLSEVPDCQDGVDNDADGLVDFPADPGCRSASTSIEDPACNDGGDNDGDGDIDFPADAECLAADDLSELLDCADGIDNDADGDTDSADVDCEGDTDPSEDPQCGDRVDNDGDGRTDYPAEFPDCVSLSDAREAPQCGDGEDNDGDGLIDYPDDPDCVGVAFPSEAPVSVALGDLLVTDRAGRRLFKVDPDTGVQVLISSGAQINSSEGVAVRPTGEIVVADPAGLLHIVAPTGEQRRFSEVLDGSPGYQVLQVAIEPDGNALVLENASISRVNWSSGAASAKTPLLSLPAEGIVLFVGSSLVLEGSGTLLVGGYSLTGDGLFRIDLTAGSVSQLNPGFHFNTWTDLAIETDGTVVAVGNTLASGPGVYRIDPTNEAVTPLSTGAEWQNPTGVALGAAGEIFVADAGSCDASGCSGGSIAKVDPVSGSRTTLSTGGLIESEMDLAVVSVLPGPCRDGIDNDGDDLVDFPGDPGCRDANAASETTACQDGVDNDGDGKVDFDGGLSARGAVVAEIDPQCADKPYRNRETPPPRRCGLGLELALLLPPWAWLRRHARRRIPHGG